MVDLPVNVGELRKQFPFPWNYQLFGRGLIRVMDAQGKEVPLPSMVGLLVTLTNIMHTQPEKV